MVPFQRTLWRAAGRIAQVLQPRCRTVLPCRLYRQAIECLSELEQRHELASRRGWTRAIQHLTLATRSQLLRLKSQVHEALEQVEHSGGHRQGPTQALIYDELVALSTEFAEFEVDLKQHTIAVVTEPIVLEDVELGRFRILFHWNKCVNREVRAYSVVALEPHYADSNSSVTHPHVLSEQLCEGDATPALQSGHLCDFFQIIQGVLRTYNSESPYATLDQWGGVDCQACGQHVAGEAEYCGHCHASVCESCCSWSEHCDGSRCDSCMSCCSHCESGCCAECLQTCVACQDHLCPNCRSSNHLCEACEHETSDHDSAEETDEEASSPAELAIQPPGVGEIIVST